jgi:hypothetical protein
MTKKIEKEVCEGQYHCTSTEEARGFSFLLWLDESEGFLS